MKNSSASPASQGSDTKTAVWKPAPYQPLPWMAPRIDAAMNGRWLPALLLGVFFATFWNPPSLPIPNLQWYVPLGLGLVAFLIEKKPFDLKAGGIFLIVFGLGFIGAVLGLLTALYPDQALWNTVGLGVSFISYVLFIPVLAARRTRQVLLVILIGLALLWVVEIQRLVNAYGTLIYSTFAETGENKNNVGFCLVLAGTALLYLAVFWKPAQPLNRLPRLLVRSGFGAAGIVCMYFMSLIYTRSGLVTAAASVLAILSMLLIRSGRFSAGLVRVVILAIILAMIILLLLPIVLQISPQWNLMAESVQTEGIDAFQSRQNLLRKGLYLVGLNPLLGVGLGGVRPAIFRDRIFPIGLVHNTYVGDWAEKGILGMLANLIWIGYYLKILRTKFSALSLLDQVWLILFVPLFVEMGFKDMGTIAVTMLAILAGIVYYQQQREIDLGRDAAADAGPA